MSEQYEYQLTKMDAATFESAVSNLRLLEAPSFAGDDVHINMYVNDTTGNCEAVWVGSNRDSYGRVREERRMILVPVTPPKADVWPDTAGLREYWSK